MSTPVVFTAIGEPDPMNADALAEYGSRVAPLLQAAGAKPRMRGKKSETIFGSDAPHTIFVAEFPNVEAVRSVFESDAYRALLPIRGRAFKSLNLMILEEF